MLITFTLKRNGQRMGRTVFPYQLIDYIMPRTRRFILLEQPFQNSEDLNPAMEIYESGALRSRAIFRLPYWLSGWRGEASKPSFRLKARDIISMVLFTRKIRSRTDLIIAIEGVNAAFAILLRSLGMTKRVVYCVVDYMPKRFENPIANGIFHALDRWCAKRADFSWSLSDVVETARRRYGFEGKHSAHVGVELACPPPIARILDPGEKVNDVVYIGLLAEKFGVRVLVESFSKVLQRVPNARLHVVGYGTDRAPIERWVESNGLGSSIIFHGMLPNDEADEVISHAKVGVAPYLIKDSNSQFIYSDVGKVKLYLAYGLPVVITSRAFAARRISRGNAGILVECNPSEIASAITELLTDDRRYQTLHQAALKLAAELTPEKVLEKPLNLALLEPARRTRSSP